MTIMFSCFHLIPERNTDGLTDGRTDRIAISISRVSVLTRDNKPVLYGPKLESRCFYIPYIHNNVPGGTVRLQMFTRCFLHNRARLLGAEIAGSSTL